MATVYKIELTSHWINFPTDDLERIIKKSIEKETSNLGNEISVEVERK